MEIKGNTKSHVFTKEDVITEEVVDQHLKQYLATADPLADRAFKVLLSEELLYKRLIASIVGDNLKETLVSINCEFIFRVKGKAIQVDTIQKAQNAIYNIEGQGENKAFSFKRHLYYWSAIFAYSLTKGNKYETLVPVVSVVIYKKTGRKKVKRKAVLKGDLLSSFDDEKLLQMYSICAAHWREEADEFLRYFLALIDLGIDKELIYYQQQGLDIASNTFKMLYNSIFISCCDPHVEKLEKTGDVVMAEAVRGYLASKDREKIRAEGWEEGRAEAQEEALVQGEVRALYQIMKLSPKEVAIKLGKEESEVISIIRELNL